LGSRPWPFGSRDVIGHVTTGFPRCGFLLVVYMNRPCISHGCWDIKLQFIWVTTLTIWGHVTPSVTWPLDSQYSVSYRWSIRTDRLSRTVIEILRFKCIGVMTLTFRVTWRHRSCDHWIPKVWFPISSQYEPTMYLSRLSRYWASEISGSRPWLFGVTWRHLSRDHWVRNSCKWSIRTDHLSRTVIAIHYGQLSFANVHTSSTAKWENFEIFKNFKI